jgi:hypothetical protein
MLTALVGVIAFLLGAYSGVQLTCWRVQVMQEEKRIKVTLL